MFSEYEMNILDNSTSENIVIDEFTKGLSAYVVSYGEFYCRENYFTKRYGMQSYLLLYTFSGEGLLTYNEKTFSLKPNALMIINCEYFQYYCTAHDDWHFQYIHFYGNGIESIMDRILTNNFLLLENLTNLSILENIQNVLNNHVLDIYMKNLKNMSELIDIFTELYALNHLSNRTYVRSNESISLAKTYMNEHFQEEFSLDQLCKAVSISKFHFIRLFKTYMSLSPYNYILFLRLNYSKTLLNQTNLSVEEIADKVGFGSACSFIRAFKKATGMTPSLFRNINLIKKTDFNLTK